MTGGDVEGDVIIESDLARCGGACTVTGLPNRFLNVNRQASLVLRNVNVKNVGDGTKTGGVVVGPGLRSFPGYLKPRSTRLELETLSK